MVYIERQRELLVCYMCFCVLLSVCVCIRTTFDLDFGIWFTLAVCRSGLKVKVHSCRRLSPFFATDIDNRLKSKSYIGKPVNSVWLKSRPELETVNK